LGVIAICLMATSVGAVTFDYPINAGAGVNSSSNDRGPAESSDELTLYFVSERPGGQGPSSLWQSTRATTNDPFSSPTNIAPTNSVFADFSPAISADGLELFFVSYRPNGNTGDIWRSTRASTNDPFAAPSILANVNSANASDDDGPRSLSPDGLTLYMYSNRGGGVGSYDLYQATRPTVNDDFGAPVSLGGAVNSASEDIGPSVTADGLTMYFMSNRPGGLGSNSIWQSTRASVNDPFGPATLVPNVNSTAIDAAPAVSTDGKRLYFQSERSGGFGGRDIWVANAVDTPSNASFSTAADLNVLDLDFGAVTLGSSVPSLTFDVANYVATGDVASMELVSAIGSGDTSKLTTNFGLSDRLQAGEFESFLSSLDTSSLGSFSASYNFSFTDVLGSNQTITLNLTGEVVLTDDPNIPDLIYNAATGEVILDPDDSSIIGYTLQNNTDSFLPGNYTSILGGVSTALTSELSEAALSPGSGSIGNVFPTGLTLIELYDLLSVNTVSRSLGAPLVPFDLIVLGPVVPEPSTYVLGALGLVGLIACGRRRCLR